MPFNRSRASAGMQTAEMQRFGARIRLLWNGAQEIILVHRFQQSNVFDFHVFAIHAERKIFVAAPDLDRLADRHAQ